MTEYNFAIYEQSYDHKIIPNIPIVARCVVRNYQKVIKNLEGPFPAELLFMLSDAMYTSAMDIEGCVFGYHNNDKISFILNSKHTAPVYKNRIQKIATVISSMMTNSFIKYYFASENPIDIIGDIVFEVSVFGMPNFTEVTNYILSEQQECFGSAISKIAELELPNMAMNLSLSTKVEMLSESGFDINSIPSSLLKGSAVYKVPTSIQINGIDMTKNKWFLDRDVTDYTKTSNTLLNHIMLQSN